MFLFPRQSFFKLEHKLISLRSSTMNNNISSHLFFLFITSGDLHVTIPTPCCLVSFGQLKINCISNARWCHNQVDAPLAYRQHLLFFCILLKENALWNHLILTGCWFVMFSIWRTLDFLVNYFVDVDRWSGWLDLTLLLTDFSDSAWCISCITHDERCGIWL